MNFLKKEKFVFFIALLIETDGRKIIDEMDYNLFTSSRDVPCHAG